jgi:RNA polymerase sigma-70 factor (ECF subfamily)
MTPEAPAPWVRAIARREALRIVAAARPVDGLEEAADDEAPPPQGVEARVDVLRAIRSLSSEERRAIGHHYWLDHTQCQTATALGIPEGTVKIRLHRARRKLRLLLA